MTKKTRPHEDSCRCRGKGCLARRKIGRAKRRRAAGMRKP